MREDVVEALIEYRDGISLVWRIPFRRVQAVEEHPTGQIYRFCVSSVVRLGDMTRLEPVRTVGF